MNDASAGSHTPRTRARPPRASLAEGEAVAARRAAGTASATARRPGRAAAGEAPQELAG